MLKFQPLSGNIKLTWQSYIFNLAIFVVSGKVLKIH
ncbi:hypothetical protein Cva_01347 [Caedimonas varicaedens]|uniref:Uncharacterized protein n=1 Tax=Caedimonas varicaedens TaxID=1629334 RepID=A0A0K8MEL7_9PROT|nr:hypothetical protein Cva_01347 [Caedimonas varicaedens]